MRLLEARAGPVRLRAATRREPNPPHIGVIPSGRESACSPHRYELRGGRRTRSRRTSTPQRRTTRSRRRDSNPRPPLYESGALPAELRRPGAAVYRPGSGAPAPVGCRAMRTLVTGATGYLGARARPRAAPRATGRCGRSCARPQAAARLDGTGAETVEGDVLDAASLERALDGVTRVFHMAGVVGHRASDEPRLRAVNVDGARNVLAACAKAGVERVVFTSSVATVGPAGGPGHPRDEGAWLIDGDDGRVGLPLRPQQGRRRAGGPRGGRRRPRRRRHEPRLRDRAGRHPPRVVVAGRGVPARPAAVHRRWRPLLRRRPRRRRRPPAGRGARPLRRALHPDERRRQPQPPRLLRPRRPGDGRAPAPAARSRPGCCGRCCGPARRCGCRCRWTTRSSRRAATGGTSPPPRRARSSASPCDRSTDTIRDTAEWLRADGYHRH